MRPYESTLSAPMHLAWPFIAIVNLRRGSYSTRLSLEVTSPYFTTNLSTLPKNTIHTLGLRALKNPKYPNVPTPCYDRSTIKTARFQDRFVTIAIRNALPWADVVLLALK